MSLVLFLHPKSSWKHTGWDFVNYDSLQTRKYWWGPTRIIHTHSSSGTFAAIDELKGGKLMELARIWLRLSPACHFCSRRGWGTGPEAEEKASLNRVGENAEASNQLPSGFRAVSNVSTLQPRDSCAQPSGRQGLTCTFLFYTPLKTLCSRGKDYALGVFHFQMFLQRAFASRQYRDPTAQASSWGAPCKNRASTLKSERCTPPTSERDTAE